MTHPPHRDDRPDPNENMPAMRARVPEHVNRGVFSTGAIVMTGGTEFILDFVQNLGRPHQIVARIIIPHVVMPQFADALSKNVELYRQRFGPLPTPFMPGQSSGPNGDSSRESQVGDTETAQPKATVDSHLVGGLLPTDGSKSDDASPVPTDGGMAVAGGFPTAPSPGFSSGPSTGLPPASNPPASNPPANNPSGSNSQGANPQPPLRKPTAQEVYDDLKLRDELLSGSYANAVMIGHGPHEFSFDFITNFYPQSAVSARVFVAAGQVERLLESLRTSWEQLKPRL